MPEEDVTMFRGLENPCPQGLVGSNPTPSATADLQVEF